MEYQIRITMERKSTNEIYNTLEKTGRGKIQITPTEKYVWVTHQGLRFKTFPLSQLLDMKITKQELTERMGISEETFDYALPQDWLNTFVKKNKSLSYHLILTTSFWAYPKNSIYGFPISGCEKVQRAIERGDKSDDS